VSRGALDTPMMRQYLAIKARHPDALLFYRMGDFYELFLRDAEVAAPLLEIALTTRDKGRADAVPMCGVPVHSADPHIKRLAELGHRVAICEQVEEAGGAPGRGLVRREVIEVVTPGLVGDPEGIPGSRELALAALLCAEGSAGLAVLDASTGEFRATRVARGEGADPAPLPPALREELLRVDPREVLLPREDAARLSPLLEKLLPRAARTLVEAARFDPQALPRRVEGLPPSGAGDPALGAAAALLSYLAANQPFALSHVARLRTYELSQAMILDAATRTHLELFANGEDGSRQRTLVERLDRSATPLGARRLARWIAYPLLDPEEIRARQDAVAWLVAGDRARGRLREALRPVRDLERLLAKAARPSATPRDLAALRGSLRALPAAAAAAGAPPDPETAAARPPGVPILEPAPEALRLLEEALVDEPPAVLRGSRGAGELGYVRGGYHSELDALREALHKGREWIAGLEGRERERSGIPSLRIRFHPVHGYALEVTKANLARVPGDYERKQTLANAERFTTAELREVEGRVRGAAERAAALERELFAGVRQAVLENAAAIRAAAEAVAELDALASLAEVARQGGWVRPEVDPGLGLEIRAGRHPVVEPLLAQSGGEFIPNDAQLDPGGTRILVLTGPNMSGKSTYLRQVALLALLAQMGSFVPAASARIGVVDRIFTRVGAADRLARGESTFMVEMRETAAILAHASCRSLVILDEIGRGTSTFDGLSIAWAVAEYLHDTPGLCPRTLFATHYHELADLARTKPRVANAHFTAREWGQEVIFLRQLVAGSASRSYGIEVARLAGLPGGVIDRAREILHNLEGGELDERGRPRLARGGAASPREGQLPLFLPGPHPPVETEVLDRLRSLDPERITPLEALEILARLVARLTAGGGA